MQGFIHVATQAALKAGKTITQSFSHLERVTVEEKSLNDFVTNVDKAAEKDIIDYIQRHYPEHQIFSEESGQCGEAGSDYTWIIDPLDGTTNFLHGVPHFAISIALSIKGRIEHGVIYDPIKDELFSASRGHGATLNNRRVRLNRPQSLKRALIATGFPYGEKANRLESYLSVLRALCPVTAGLRRSGSAALDLAYVAAGRYDGFWELSLNPWDMAAGVLMVQEAGGDVTDLKGEANYFKNGDVVATHPQLQQPLLDVIQNAYPDHLS